MSYQINKTNGELLTELVDGTIDSSSTDITLVGRNYKGYGEAFNENFVSLLENFASTSAPTAPMVGQLWYDTSDARLKIYDGTSFRTAGGPIVSPQQPNNLVSGDLWINNSDNKLYMWDGTDLTLVGPTYTAGQGKTVFEAVSMIDTANQPRTVLALYIGGGLAGILSRQDFIPAVEYALPPYAVGRRIEIGFNPVDVDAFKFRGSATSSESLVDSQGNVFTSADFVRTNERDSQENLVTQEILGSFHVKGTDGVAVGIGDTPYARFKTPFLETTSVIELLETNTDFSVRVKQGNTRLDAVYVDTSESRVGIFNNTPTTGLDVAGGGKFAGDVIVEGDLTVNGSQTVLNTETYTVEDKNIELNITDGVAAGGDIVADTGGVILKSTDGDKTLTWINSTSNWTSNQNFDLTTGNEFRIENVQVLSKTRLGDTVTTAAGLTTVGTLNELSVTGNITLGGNLEHAGPLNILTGGTISVDNVRITGLDAPANIFDATNKGYVDTEIATIPTSFSLDITGFSNPNTAGAGAGPYNDVINVLNDIAPVTAANNGAIAKVHCISYASATITGINVSISTAPDSTGTLQKSFIAVDSAGTQNESVVQDISTANTTSGSFTPTVDRYTMTFAVQSGSWAHQDTTNYS